MKHSLYYDRNNYRIILGDHINVYNPQGGLEHEVVRVVVRNPDELRFVVDVETGRTKWLSPKCLERGWETKIVFGIKTNHNNTPNPSKNTSKEILPKWTVDDKNRLVFEGKVHGLVRNELLAKLIARHLNGSCHSGHKDS